MATDILFLTKTVCKQSRKVLPMTRIKSYTNTQGYVFPNVHEVPKPNPQAQVAKFDGINLSEVENNLVEAVRAIKQEETK